VEALVDAAAQAGFGVVPHMFPTRTFALTAAAVAALSVTAAAQVAAPPDTVESVRRDARIHVGPFYMTPTVRLKELGVDTNVFNENGETKSDFAFTVTPRANVWIPVARRALFTATAASDLVWYARYSSERSINPQFTGRGELYLNRITLFGENAYLNTRARPNYEIDLRSRHLENDATVGAEVQITPKLSLEAALLRGITRYDADARFDGTSLQRTLNRDNTGMRLVGRHRLTPLTTLALRYENLSDRFPYSAARNADSVRVMPGVEFKARALITGTAYVGYRQFTAEFPALLPEFSGLVAQLGLSYTVLGATTLGVSYRRDLTYSYEELQPFFVNNAAGASIRRALGRRFDVLLSLDRHKYAYENLVPLPGVKPGPERIDTTWVYAGSFGYRLGREGRVGFGVSYDDRSSTTNDLGPYNGLRAGTVMSYGF
jgi:putative beta-barrel porin BBP2